MFITVLETRNFTFYGSGFTKSQAVSGLRHAWNNHCKQYTTADKNYGKELIDEGDFSTHQFPIGKGVAEHADDITTPDAIPLAVNTFSAQASPLGKYKKKSLSLEQIDDIVSHAQQTSIAFAAFQAGTLKMAHLADILAELSESLNPIN